MLRLIRTSKLDGKLLDVGCAYGLLANFASEHFETYGIDVSRFAVEKSKIYCRGNIAKASAVDIPFRGETFDVITVLDTLEHVPSLTQCLEDIYRALKKNGVLLLQLPNTVIWHLCKHMGLSDETHMSDFGLQEWKAVLSSHWFKVEKVFGIATYALKRIPFFVKSEKAAEYFQNCG